MGGLMIPCRVALREGAPKNIKATLLQFSEGNSPEDSPGAFVVLHDFERGVLHRLPLPWVRVDEPYVDGCEEVHELSKEVFPREEEPV